MCSQRLTTVIRTLNAVAIGFLLATGRSAPLYAHAPNAGLAFEEIAPPPEESNAIRLSGRSENPTPETWLRVRGTEAAAWWSGPTGQIVVRNVSQATLTPFLPSRAKASGAAMILAPEATASEYRPLGKAATSGSPFSSTGFVSVGLLAKSESATIER
jgi:hypothetical protein